MAKHLNTYKEADTVLSYIWDALSARKREPKHADYTPPTKGTKS